MRGEEKRGEERRGEERRGWEETRVEKRRDAERECRRRKEKLSELRRECTTTQVNVYLNTAGALTTRQRRGMRNS